MPLVGNKFAKKIIKEKMFKVQIKIRNLLALYCQDTDLSLEKMPQNLVRMLLVILKWKLSIIGRKAITNKWKY